ncbi:MAG: hypothetical protein JWP58_3908 [Hymenobacter sp.]|nr:hypothetical protein [Hymenobacter sp.]
MICLAFSYWWLLLPLAVVLLAIVAACDNEGGIGGGLKTLFVALVCLAIFLIVLAAMAGYSLAHP